MPVRSILDDRDVVPLPKFQRQRMQLLRDELLEQLADAADDLGAGLDGDVRQAIRRIKAGDYSDAVIRRETRWLSTRHADRLGEALAGQVEHAASLGARYAEMMDAFKVQYINPRPLTDYQTEWLLRHGRTTARQALAPEVLLAQAAQPEPARFVADRILAEHVKPWRQARVLSGDLHGKAIKAADEVASQAMAAVREAKQLTEASTSMIRAVRKTGAGEVAGNQELSALMKRVQDAGQKLNQRGGEEALAEWRSVRKQMRHNMRRLAEGGRARSSMLELLQRTSDDSAKGIDRAIRQHSAFQQKYAAERIIKSETMASFKAEQVLSDQKHDFIVGYIWRMQRAARAGFVARRTSKSGRIIGAKKYRRGGRRRRCVCESLDGKRLSVEAVRGKNARLMAHPHCMCYLDPVFDKRRLNAPISAAEFGELD